MSLTPEQIVAEEFRLRARGYDRDEVDAYLDRLADQVEADTARVRAVEERLGAVEADLAAAREREATLTRTLATVQDAADRARADAEAEVAALRAETERELTVAREQAEQEAERLRADAEHAAEQVRADAHHEAAELRAHLAEVQHLDATYREQLRGHLQAQLEALDAQPDPYAGLQAGLAPATDTAETATPGPWGFRDPGRTAETADVPPEPASEDREDVAPSAGLEPADPAHGPDIQEPVSDRSPAGSGSDEPTEDGPGQDPHTSQPRSEEAPEHEPNAHEPHPQDAPGDEPDLRDPHPQDASDDLDAADGDDEDDPWRRRDEHGQPVEPDPPIWG